MITIFDNLGDIGMMIHGSAGQGRIEWYLSDTKYVSAYVNPVTGDNSLIFTSDVHSTTTGFGFEASSGAILNIGRQSADAILLSAKNISLDSADGGIGMYAPAISMGGSQYVSIASPYEVTITCPNGTEIIGGLHVAGTLTATNKSNVELTDSYGLILLTVRESPDHRYIDEGIGVLINGECRINLDPVFLECIEPDTPDTRWNIQLTPYGKAMLYIDEIGEDYFVVKDYHEVADGIEFSWSLSATRRDYANIRFVEVV
jgi:hypothetical protein